MLFDRFDVRYTLAASLTSPPEVNKATPSNTMEKSSSKIENATFERIKPIVLGFGPLSLPIRMNPRTIGLIRSKVAFSVFHPFRPIRRSIYPGRLINFSPGMYNFSQK